MLQKFANIFKILTSCIFYQELANVAKYYYYEHALPLSKIQKGNGVVVHPSVNIHFGENISLENNVRIREHCTLFASKNSKITIGPDTGIGARTTLISINHRFIERKGFRKQESKEKDIVIENDVWIGQNCMILYGVTIGKNSTIAAGTVVSKNIPPYSVVSGKSRKLTIITRPPS